MLLGPHALACASQIPDRLTACGVACRIGPLEDGTAGMSPGNRLALFTAQRFPWLWTPLLWTLARPYREEETASRVSN